MTDIATAIQMEEEALQRMKKSRIVKKSLSSSQLSGILNPNCVGQDEAQAKHTTQASISRRHEAPDLMSFQDVSKPSTENWQDFESQNTKAAHNTTYDRSISSVMSLFNTPGANLSPQKTMSAQQSSFQQSSNPGFAWQTDAPQSSDYFSRNLSIPSVSPRSVPRYNLSSGSVFSQHKPLTNTRLSFTNESVTLPPFSSQTLPAHSAPNPFITSRPIHSKSNTLSENYRYSPTHFFSATFANEVDGRYEGYNQAKTNLPRPSSLGQLQGRSLDSPVFDTSPTLNQAKSASFATRSLKVTTENAAAGLRQTSSFGSGMQALNINESQDDELTSAKVFDDWLNDEWSIKSRSSTQETENNESAKSKPDWLEWDPLQNISDSVAATTKAKLETESEPALASPETEVFATVSKTNSTKHDHTDEKVFQNEKNDNMDVSVEIDESTELQRFARMVAQLRSGFKHVDHLSNPGHVISLMTASGHWPTHTEQPSLEDDDDASVRISVTADGITQPVTFECDVNASVEHIVSQALCIAYEDISCVSMHDYFFKVVGRQEYLINKSRLSLYQYVQECRKFEQDVRLELLHKSQVDQALRRTADDDSKTNVDKDFLELLGKPPQVVGRDDIQILVEAFYKEAESLLGEVKQDAEEGSAHAVVQLERLIQSVKAMCSSLGNIETLDIIEEIKKLRAALIRPPNSPSLKNKKIDTVNDLMSVSSDEDLNVEKFKKIHIALENLTSALLDLTQLYCKACEVDAYFHIPSCEGARHSLPQVTSTSVKDLYSVNLVSLQRMPKLWETTYDEFYATCSLWHGEKQISQSKSATKPSKMSKHFYARVLWNKWIEFDVSVSELPLEVTLRVVVHGTIASDEKIMSKRLAWLNIPLFDHQQLLKNRNELYGMWDLSKGNSKSIDLHGSLNCSNDILNSGSLVIHVAFSEDTSPTMVVKHAQCLAEKTRTSIKWQSISSLDQNLQDDLKLALSHARAIAGPLLNLSQLERDILWRHRHIVGAPNSDNRPVLGLPILLQCVPRWTPSLPHPQDAYDLLSSWSKRLEPEEALALLTSAFPDSQVRSAAIRWLEAAGDMEIASWLPQLVQAVRCELHHDSPLTRLLLRRALGSIRICHKLYWLLHENMWDDFYGDRYSMIHAALLTTCGSAVKKEFERELYFLKMINRVAESVRDAKDSMKTSTLNDDLSKVAQRVSRHRFRIPTNPALVTNGLNVKNSSYYTSNAVPLKLAFTNPDGNDSDIFIMYKVGDDLRQDALTMQLIRVMDRMWLNEGLDLRIVTFDCLPTALNQGMVEIISDSKTFREIQSSYGLTGAFKDRPIAEWLQKYNPTGLSYERAVENFTLSCAGYCVATYVLGICDRHNDNIMLRNSGHLFHIDFARFLGHAQMFGNIKRDRAPFVLTSDMAYVINGGDRPSSKFQDFVDVCCRAFNILRKQSHTIINLLSLMINCGIPELQSKSNLKYVYDTLKPNASDTEATTMFTRLIDASLSSSFTRLNFFIHNLAQMRFHGNESEEDKRTLSFSPQIHGYKEEEGIITMATVVGYQKRYSPEKYYVYCIKVTREKNTTSIESYLFRTFDEFEELHRKLSSNSLQLPNFPNSVVVGRSQVKQVADRRKAKLNSYLSQLLKSARNVALHDLVYTFFHPILRDEEQEMKPSVKSPDVTVGGEIKVSLHYKNNAFYIMVNHCKNLSPVNGADPDPYVKTYLLPDPNHSTKRKTKVARKTLHPTYNEMLVYNLALDEVKSRRLQIGVWNYENLQENDYMGSVIIDLSKIDLTVETSKWHLLKSTSL